MASHARPKPSRIPRSLLRAGLTVSAAGAALAAGGTAHAEVVPVSSADTNATASALSGALTTSLGGAVNPVRNLQLNPLAKTPVDPLTNGVGTQVADFKPVGTELLTGTLSRGGALKDLPLVGKVTRILPG
ncbi:hypothetical protein [Streptomyces pinistramenti]|uniref:hypothetical protein n=1 Tax=Streptomyces pinistramenti TaxID=2884812 RepID=UPI001D082E2D|nr:hypothetical protein [Streptomyces pinistramenti]MCB5909597.1 hypothetical protein [Streptomyces pinistramenti]